MNAKIYMNVPFSEKDSAKSLGALWDAGVKKWYFEGPVKEISKFGKWLSGGREQTLIVYENFCIIEARRICFKCKNQTRIIGFGIREHSILEDNQDGSYSIGDPDDLPELEDEMYLAWADDESKIPPLLLSYLTSRYSVRTGYSSVVGKSFANHCDHCGIIQGNHYLFVEDSPLSTSTPVEKELVERMSQLKIYNVYTDVALALNWDISYCSNDWAYIQYTGTPFEDLTLPGAEDMFTSYMEMFSL
jgi:hypothetical protein